jgi:hypothetical protein
VPGVVLDSRTLHARGRSGAARPQCDGAGRNGVALSQTTGMRDMDWSEQVVVKRLVPDETVWDGITLDVAVQRIMDLPPNERVGLTIFAQSGAYDGKQIEALFDRLRQSK